MAKNFLGVSPGISVSGETVGAKWSTVESTGFNGTLASTDNTVQKCLQKLDDLTILTTENVQDTVGSLLTDSSSVNFTYDDTANTLTAVVLPAGVAHDSLSGYSANRHIDHSAVSITAGTGLSGGGTLEATRTLTLANTTVSAASYGSATQVGTFTVDAQGRLTAAGNTTVTPAWSSITSKPTTLAGYGITDAQPVDADLTAIGALAGTSGLLKKTAANTWTLDTTSYSNSSHTHDLANITGTLLTSAYPIQTISNSTYNIYQNVAFYSCEGIYGTIKITMPFSWNDTYLTVFIEGWDGNAIGNWKVEVSATLSSSPEGFLNAQTNVYGATPFGNMIRMGHDGTKCCILLGEVGDWSLVGKIVITQVRAAGNLTPNWSTGWTIERILSETGITKIVSMTSKNISYHGGKTSGPIIVCGSTGKFIADSTLRQIIELTSSAYGIGVQDYTLYNRTLVTTGGFSWYQGGVHSDTQNDPGSGGSVLAKIDSNGNMIAKRGFLANDNAYQLTVGSDFSWTPTNTTGAVYSIYNYSICNPGTNLTGNLVFYGIRNSAYSSITNAQAGSYTVSLYGAYNFAGSSTASGNDRKINSIIGSINQANSNSIGFTIPSSIGADCYSSNYGGTDITTAKGVYGRIYAGSVANGDATVATAKSVDSYIYCYAGSTITNSYLYYGDYTNSGTITNKWGLYLSDEGKNYLSGDLALGTTSPSAKLHALKTTEQLRLGYDSTHYTSFVVNSSSTLNLSTPSKSNVVTLMDSGCLGINHTAPNSLFSIKGNVENCSATLGSELLSSSGWTTTGWTGDFATGFTHTVGNTTALLNSFAPTVSTKYHFVITISGRTAGTVTFTFGGCTSTAYTATANWGPTAKTVDSLVITPTSTFDGKVVLSLKEITAPSTPLVNFYESGGNSRFQINVTTATFNTLVGYNAGEYITTASYSTIIGYSAGQLLTTGSYNTFIGYLSGSETTTGTFNIALGASTLRDNNEGNFNTALGHGALLSNTKGAGHTGVGYQTLYYTTGSGNTALGYGTGSAITTGSYNTIIGYNVEAPSNTGDYQLVIANLIFGTGCTGTGTTIAGLCGIGTNAPAARLHTLSTTEQFRISYDATKYVSHTVDSSGNVLIDAVGNTKIGDGTNYTQFATDGTLTLAGTATAWDDLLIEMKESLKGALTKPDWDATNFGLLFPQNDTTEYIVFNVQMPHRWKEGSTIYPHVHFFQNQNVTPTFKIDYRWVNIGDAVPSFTTGYTMSTIAGSQTWTTGMLHRIVGNTSGISGSGKTMSSMLQIKLYRQDNTYVGDCLVVSFDIHFEIDSFGSASEYTK